MTLATNIMTRSVITVKPNEYLKPIFDLMTENDIRHIPVIENQLLVGIVSRSDILSRSTLHNDNLEIPKLEVRTVMTKKVITCTPHTRLSDIAGTFISCNISCMLVVHGETLVGIVTTSDLLDQFCIEEELGGHMVMPLSFFAGQSKFNSVKEKNCKNRVKSPKKDR